MGALLGVVAGARPAAAQDLEPKAYSASPVGTTFLVFGLFDKLQDARGRLAVAVAGEAESRDSLVGLARTGESPGPLPRCAGTRESEVDTRLEREDAS